MARAIKKPKYRTEGLGKNKGIKEGRKKHIPTDLMNKHIDSITLYNTPTITIMGMINGKSK